MDLVAQTIETHGDGRLAGPCIHRLTAAHQLGRLAHTQVELVLLGFAEGLAQLRGRRWLRARHVPRRGLHLIFEILQISRHGFFFAGHTVHLLRILARLRAPGSVLGRVAEHTPKTILKILLLFGEVLGLTCHLIELRCGLLLTDAAQKIAGFLKTVGCTALAGVTLLGIAVLR